MAVNKEPEKAPERINIFQGKNGAYSMRRFLAFMMIVASIAVIILAIIFQAEWKVILAAGGSLIVGAIFLLFFTTWGDVKGLIEAARGDDD